MAQVLNPLPSLIRASAHDAAAASARKACRKAWSRADYNAACETQNRLIRACYGRSDDSDERLCFIRFQIAEQFEREGRFGLDTPMVKVHRAIDLVMSAPVAEVA